MIRFVQILLLIAGVGGCVSTQRAEEEGARQARMAEFKAAASQAEADYLAKKITFGQMMSKAADARLALAPNDPLAIEGTYFTKLQAARVDRGEISIEEFRYLVAKNENESSARRQASAVQALTAISAMQATQPVSCNRIGNSVTCY